MGKSMKINILKLCGLACLSTTVFSLSSCNSKVGFYRTRADAIMDSYELSTAANADGGSANLAYYIHTENNVNTAVVMQGTCSDAAVTIPATYRTSSDATTTYTVVGIKESGFANDSTLTSVTFSGADTITMLGSQSFSNCTALTSFTVPANVTEVGPSTFTMCRALQTISFATNSLCTAIGDHAFAGDVALTTVGFPTPLLSVGEACFQGCISLVRAIFKDNFTTLGAYAFDNCTTLGLAYFPTTIATIGEYAFKNCPKAWAFFAGSLPSGYTATDQWWNYLYGTTSVSSLPVGTDSTDYVPIFTNKARMGYADPGYYYTRDTADVDPAHTTNDYDIVIDIYTGSTNKAGAGSVSLSIPNTITDDSGTHRVVGVGSEAFLNHTEIGALTFDANMRFFDNRAFFGCSNIGSIAFTEAGNLQTIGDYAFASTGNNTAFDGTLTIPTTVTSIGSYAFQNFVKGVKVVFTQDALPASNVPATTLTIGSWAFYGFGQNEYSDTARPNITLTLPYRLISCGEEAFQNALFISKVTFTSKISLSLGIQPFYGLKYLNEINLPTSCAGDMSIGSWCFGLDGWHPEWNWPTVHSLYIPANVKTLGKQIMDRRFRATFYCEVVPNADGTFPEGYSYGTSVKSGDRYTNTAFFDSYDSNTLGTGVTLCPMPVYYNVGSGTSQRHLIHTANAQNQVEFDFVDTAQTPTSPRTFTCSRYYYEGATSVDLTPEVPGTITDTDGTTSCTVDAIGDQAFLWSCLNKINSWAVDATSAVTSVTIPNSILSIGEYAFAATRTLSAINNGTAGTFPTSLKTLARFSCCFTALSSVNLPSSITSFVMNSNFSPFIGCYDLTTLQIGSDSTANGKTYYSSGNGVYQASGTGAAANHYKTLLTVGDGVSGSFSVNDKCTTIGVGAFRAARSITSISIPYTVTSIGNYACDSLSGDYDPTGSTNGMALQSVRFRAVTGVATSYGLTSIGTAAFQNCTNLQTFELPTSLVSIGQIAFMNDTNLAFFPSNSTDAGTQGLLDLGSYSSLNSIGNQAFQNCTGITSLTLPTNSAYTKVNDNVFNGCTNIATSSAAPLTIPSNITSIGSTSFYNCDKLTDVSFPTTLTSLGVGAFRDCNTLVNVTFPSGSLLNNIGKTCFQQDPGLTSLDFHTLVNTTTLTIDQSAFLKSVNLARVILPADTKFTNFSETANWPFSGCTSMPLSTANPVNGKGIFLMATGAQYSTVKNTNYANGWNYRSSETPLMVACHATTAAEATCSADINMKFWHFSNGIPTYGYGTDTY